MTCDEFKALIDSIDGENEYIEFKLNYAKTDKIGSYMSALANSAALNNQNFGYLLFGIDDDKNIVGTNFNPEKEKIGNENLIHWLYQRIDRDIDFKVNSFMCDEKKIVVFVIDCAKHKPVRFMHKAYIRIGSITRELIEFPEKERELWKRFEPFCFEEEIALSDATEIDVLSLLDHEKFFKLLKIPYNTPSKENIIDKFLEYDVVKKANINTYSITNLGALLFAKNITDFKTLSNSRIRVIEYNGINKLKTKKETESTKGYAVGFQSLVKFIMNLLPKNELIRNAIRQENLEMYPEVAIRELIANALIHQDFSIKGTSPMIEIYSDRIEITNSGKPLIDVLRLIDYQPKSRNEKLAKLMRLMGICEERGSGIDKVISYVEIFQLPAPEFKAEKDYFKVVIYAHRKFIDMDRNDRIRATYQHCCLQYVSNNTMTNNSLRERFGLDEGSASKVSKIISDTLETKLIKLADPSNKSPKYNKYVPFWA